MKEYFVNLLKLSDIDIYEEKIDKLIIYLEMLIQKNKVMNLTAIRDSKDMIEKHFIDALLLTKVIGDEENTLVDLGTGAGFPGLVLAIYYPEKNFLLVDSVKKKIAFLDEVIEKLQLKNVKTSSERAEEIIKKYREKFDVALCRGVANLRIILEYMIPFVKSGGRFLPQKLNLNEVEESSNALKLLHSSIDAIHRFNLPVSKDERIILEIRKNSKTSLEYPRATGIPSKKPL
ncbi:16S rRNA (guanine(527)-N(7))-methyltransferase RsmG [Streptobacillus notomytis]|uniref:16S rRNA (guanine(527)-N(7))-methyltransferase RsmG n=1 Tax=Streptobacillus notomytis TaxID=1712031 RepID=UPI000935DC16|nr:16S rRNA (guanine(527)-N(7))-methyltransferase RsmG [Streptobacillus notomytis]